MIRLQRAVEMSGFGNWKNSDIPPSAKLLLLLLYIANVTISKKKGEDFVFYHYFFLISTSSFVLNFVCFREIIAGFGIDESYNYMQLVI